MLRGNPLVLMTVLALAAIIAGCAVDGDITITNDSSTLLRANLEGEDFEIEPGGSHSQNVYIGKSFGFIGPSEYNVLLYGSAWTKRYFEDVVTAKGGETTTYTVKDDVGAFDFINNFTTIVNQISISRCACDTVGCWVDLLEMGKSLGPGIHLLIQVDAGCWDLEITYSKDDLISYMRDELIEIGQVRELSWIP